jgi:hypothetical protein
VFDLNRQRDDLRGELRRLESDLRENLQQNEEQGQISNMFR